LFDFEHLTTTNGFDFENLVNARQNNYAWSMAELGDYIYVGTGRNILANIIKAFNENIALPSLVGPCCPAPLNNQAEIWRYKKNGLLPWNRVYTAPLESGIFGFRYMVQHRPFGGSPCLYAAGYGRNVEILKSTNGCDWCKTENNLQGTSSRAMVSHKGKLYVATVDALGSGSDVPLLYRSEDPEFCPWELVTDTSAPNFDPDKNPRGAISNMTVFNDRIYVATSNPDGVQVWRSNSPEPKLNDWTLIVDGGFGNPSNKYSLAMGVFKKHLYVSATKPLPLAWAIPMGCEIIRIDKKDNWQLVVGGRSLLSPLFGNDERKSISGLGPGFNNPFNVYGWQIQEYRGKLFVSTFDDSSNMEVILTTLLANRSALEQLISPALTKLLIEIYEGIVQLLRLIKYPGGFDLYVSDDGVNFSPVFLDGLANPKNYGGRILFVDSNKNLYIGTANPIEGCEVWRVKDIGYWDLFLCDDNHYNNIWKSNEAIIEKINALVDNMPAISKILTNDYLF